MQVLIWSGQFVVYIKEFMKIASFQPFSHSKLIMFWGKLLPFPHL
jgi:hypothetical protein